MLQFHGGCSSGVRALDCGSGSRGSNPSVAPFSPSKVYIVSLIQALFLGLIQGITEFLPISSSGHLKLMQYLLGWKDLKNLIAFDLVCHLGTLLAIIILLRKDIWGVYKNSSHVELHCFSFASIAYYVPFSESN